MSHFLGIVRVSTDNQDTLRQVNGILAFWEANSYPVPAGVLALIREAVRGCQDSHCPVELPPNAYLLQDVGRRDEAEKRPHFQAVLARVTGQHKTDAKRLRELTVYEFDRLGVKDIAEAFHFIHLFRQHGCKIVSVRDGDLTAKDDATLMRVFLKGIVSSKETQNLAGRVAGQFAELAKHGRLLGGIPNWGFDLGCFDGDKLVWRLHYLDWDDRLQLFPPDENGNTPAPVAYKGRKNHPTKSPNQRYRLIPSVDSKRIQCIREAFRIASTQLPAVGMLGILKQLAALGYGSYNGRGFDKATIEEMLRNPVYIGFKARGRYTKAKFKRYSNGRIEDVPEAEQGKFVRKPRAEWIIPTEPTNQPLIDEATFNKVQDLLDKLPKRQYYAPRSDSFYLKPLLFCGQCGRGMVGKTIRGKAHYHCLTSVYRSNRPGDPRFQTECGFNRVGHDEVEKLILSRLDGMRVEIGQEIEAGAVKRLEEEICRNLDLAWAVCQHGFKGHLRDIWDALELEAKPDCQLTPLVRFYLALAPDEPTDLDTFVAGLQEVERLKVVLARQLIDQLGEEHRTLTLAQARPGVTPLQRQVYQCECVRIEGRISALDKHLSPLEEQVEKLNREYAELLDRLEDAKKTVRQGENRAKGAALARVFSKVLLFFTKENEGHKGRGRHGRIISVWQPERTQFVPAADSPHFTQTQAFAAAMAPHADHSRSAGPAGR